jgi:hypothetical protein
MPVDLTEAIDNGLVIGNGYEKLKCEYAACADKSCFATRHFGKHKRHFEAVKKAVNLAENAYIKELFSSRCPILAMMMSSKFFAELWCLNHQTVWLNVMGVEMDKLVSGSFCYCMMEIARVSIINLLI